MGVYPKLSANLLPNNRYGNCSENGCGSEQLTACQAANLALVRFARLMSVFANIRNHHLDPIEYLCDVFRRIKNTSKEKLVDLLSHRWQSATVAVWLNFTL